MEAGADLAGSGLSAATGDGTLVLSVDTGIGNGKILVCDSNVEDDDFLRINGTSVEGRNTSEVLSDMGAQASLTFGISNTNAVKIDHASVAEPVYLDLQQMD